MGTPLTDLIGKKDPWCAWEVNPVPYAEHKAGLEELAMTMGNVTLRLRSDIDMLSGSHLKRIKPTLDSLDETRGCLIIVHSTHVKRQRRMKYDTYDLRLNDDGTATVPFKVGAIILASEIYGAVFEEVDDGKSTQASSSGTALPSPKGLAEVRELRALIESQQAQIAKLVALSTPKEIEPEDAPLFDAPPPPKSKRNKRKDK